MLIQLVSSSYGAVVLDAIFPEAASREFLLYYHSESVHQTLTNSHDVTCRKRRLTIEFSKPYKCKPGDLETTIPAE